jgi:hypothetical protein
MKSYPSIPRDFEGFDAYVFDKLDGSNLRFEWTKKRGFNKFGTRHRLFDHTDPQFAKAIPLFMEKFSEPFGKLAKDNRWEELVVFAEFYGPKSFAGYHDPTDQHELAVFDLDVYKKGLMGPKDYLKTMEPLGLPMAKYLGHVNWTRGFIDSVWNGEVACTFEGVIGKGGSKSPITMRKAKTKAWIDRIKGQFTTEEAEALIDS